VSEIKYRADIFHSSCLFFQDSAPTEIYTLSLHDALPICLRTRAITTQPIRLRDSRRIPTKICGSVSFALSVTKSMPSKHSAHSRSEEHTSELQSRGHLVCRPLLEKKNR